MKLVTYEIATALGRLRRLGILADGDESVTHVLGIDGLLRHPGAVAA